jgi:hypothetical protein
VPGIHRDGRRVLGIFCVNRRGIGGGVTELHRTRDGAGEPLVRTVLEPGQALVCNDRLGGVFHYTNKVWAAQPPEPGVRDVLVLVC